MVYKCEVPEYHVSMGQANLIFKARMLWRDVATWLTIYMFSLYGGYANHELIESKLFQLPIEYGNMLKLIFGERSAEGYITLLTNYINILKNLFHAQLAGDVNAASEYIQQLYQNIDQRAAYLARINPFWQESAWKTLLLTFNNMILEDSASLLDKKYEQNIIIFDRLLSQSSIMGDYFSEGIFDYLTYSAGASYNKV